MFVTTVVFNLLVPELEIIEGALWKLMASYSIFQNIDFYRSKV